MKKNKWVLLLIAFVAFLVLVYFIGACLNATAEALTIISLCIGILVIYLVAVSYTHLTLPTICSV